MSQTHFYEVNVQWKEGRIGELSSPILEKTIECATPPEFPNGVPNIWSPEHLFVAAINSCYMATYLAIASNFKVELEDFSCRTVAKLEMVDGKYLITQAELFPTIKLKDINDAEKAQRIADKSKAGCLVTNSMKTEILMTTKIS
ncbi:MAG TPA: OsmC family protein [Bacteroidia bacterium]|jgi:organic hydroperoxide reductase OsmC/OhrA|nr:OsmC family protein [Bacteroidia bacterium]HNF32501.1 OsmC family protein [Bacteroidia bacterium]HNF40944.1 OsmC family protein [Bacteroidia bacterium]